MSVMVELCCGTGSVSAAFIAHGWTCRGYDIVQQPSYPGHFVLADIMTLTQRDLDDAGFIWCSTPCQEFAVHCMKHFHPNPPRPNMGMALFYKAQQLCCAVGAPHILENVRCAQRFVGPAVNHCGPFYLWGDAVPAIFPAELFKLVKGCTMRTREQAARMGIPKNSGHRTASRKKRAAMVSVIPHDLASYIAACVTHAETSAACLKQSVG